MKLFEVKIQDPETGEWFEKTQKSFESYFKKFNNKYFNNELPNVEVKPMNFIEAKSALCLGQSFAHYHAHNRTIDYEIKINKDYISSFEEFRIVLVHEMNHLWVNIHRHFSKEQWNEALNYGLYCNKNNIKPDIVEFEKCLGINPGESHKGEWLEKANELNVKFKEFNNELQEYYNCTVDDDSIDELQAKLNVFIRTRKNENTLYIYNDNDEYKTILKIIERGYSKQNIAEGKWYKVKIKKDEIFSFVRDFSGKMCTISDFNAFKDNYVDSIEFLNTVKLVTIDEDYVYFPNDGTYRIIL